MTPKDVANFLGSTACNHYRNYIERLDSQCIAAKIKDSSKILQKQSNILQQLATHFDSLDYSLFEKITDTLNEKKIFDSCISSRNTIRKLEEIIVTGKNAIEKGQSITNIHEEIYGLLQQFDNNDTEIGGYHDNIYRIMDYLANIKILPSKLTKIQYTERKIMHPRIKTHYNQLFVPESIEFYKRQLGRRLTEDSTFTIDEFRKMLSQHPEYRNKGDDK